VVQRVRIVGLVAVLGFVVLTLVRHPGTTGAWWVLVSVPSALALIALWTSGRLRPARAQSLGVHVWRALAFAGTLVFAGGVVDSLVYTPVRVETVTIGRHNDTGGGGHGYRYQVYSATGTRYSVPKSVFRSLVDGRTYRCRVEQIGHLTLEPPVLLSCGA
jgi:hypothetical protein